MSEISIEIKNDGELCGGCDWVLDDGHGAPWCRMFNVEIGWEEFGYGSGNYRRASNCIVSEIKKMDKI